MFDSDKPEDFEDFREWSERLFGWGAYSEAGKHTNNVVLALPMTLEEYEQAVQEGTRLLEDPIYQGRRETEIRNEVFATYGSPPEGVEIEVGTDTFGKGAAGPPGQFLEFIIQAGGAYGGLKAFYDIGHYLISIVQRVGQERKALPTLNKAGVVAVCAVDLVENRSVEEYELRSAVEIIEGHRWDPAIDGRDIYCVTFTDYPDGEAGYVYLATASGAILNYKQISLAESPILGPWFIEPRRSDKS